MLHLGGVQEKFSIHFYFIYLKKPHLSKGIILLYNIYVSDKVHLLHVIYWNSLLLNCSLKEWHTKCTYVWMLQIKKHYAIACFMVQKAIVRLKKCKWCNCICHVPKSTYWKKYIFQTFMPRIGKHFILFFRLLKNMMKPSDRYSYGMDMYLVYSECIMKTIPSSNFLGNRNDSKALYMGRFVYLEKGSSVSLCSKNLELFRRTIILMPILSTRIFYSFIHMHSH